jgi:hypothetical protein
MDNAPQTGLWPLPLSLGLPIRIISNPTRLLRLCRMQRLGLRTLFAGLGANFYGFA